MRIVTHRYEDPLERIWRSAVAALGIRVERCTEVFASTNGEGLLRIGDPASLDADDCLAQMIFHELCHGAVEGPDSVHAEDWGLDLEGRDVHREHATLRLQAHLARPYGLGRVLAPTGIHRPYYEALGPDPLARVADDPAEDGIVVAAIAGAEHAERPPFGPHLREALAATERVVAAVAPLVEGTDSLFALYEPPG